MSALSPIADIGPQPCDVRFVPKADSVVAARLLGAMSGFKERVIPVPNGVTPYTPSIESLTRLYMAPALPNGSCGYPA
jgi:hypothetical protein